MLGSQHMDKSCSSSVHSCCSKELLKHQTQPCPNSDPVRPHLFVRISKWVFIPCAYSLALALNHLDPSEQITLHVSAASSEMHKLWCINFTKLCAHKKHSTNLSSILMYWETHKMALGNPTAILSVWHRFCLFVSLFSFITLRKLIRPLISY